MTNSNPGGPGGKRRKIPVNKPQGKTSHRAKKSSGSASGAMMAIAVAMLAIPASVIAGVTFFLLHGHGVI